MKPFCFLATLFIFFTATAQHKHLNGTVSSNENPLFATIKVKNSSQYTSTDINGEYHLDIPQGTSKLIVSALGYKTKEVIVTLAKDEYKTVDINLKEDVLGLDKVVVTATRGYLNRRKAPVIVTVTDAKVLEAVQAVSLSEGLNFQPGLRVENNCQNCGTSEIKMNGLSGSYSQILVDSRPVFSALNSVYGLDQIPANIIKQIEVVRGGGSALYGSNAIAGTINIITKDPTENSFAISTNYALLDGDAQDKTLSFNGTIVNEDFDTGIALFGSKRERESLDIDGDSFSEIPELESSSFGLKAFHRPSDRKKITADFNTSNEFRRGGDQLDKLPYLAGITEQIESTVVTGGLTYEYLTPNRKDNLSVYASTSISNNKNYYGGIQFLEDGSHEIDFESSLDGFGTSEDVTFVTGTQYSHKFDKFLNNTGTFTGGIEYKYNDINDQKENPDFTPIKQTTEIYGIYAQQEWVVSDKLRILGGLRGDIHNLADENVVLNPRANFLYTINENLRWRTSYAKGFRAPQIYGEDVHAGLAGGEISQILNADGLKSETSHSFLTSLDWNKELTNGEFSLVTELFYTKLEDAFSLEKGNSVDDDSSVFVWTRDNSEGAKVYGVNLELKYAPNEKWLLQSGATFQRATFDEQIEWTDGLFSRDFNETPNIYGNFILTYAPIKEFQNNLSGVYTGRMKVQHLAGFIPEDRLETSDAFYELNWKTSYQFYLDDHKHNYIQIYGGVQNIFDSYQDDFDQGVDRDATYNYGPQRPRTYFVGLKFGG